MTKKLGKYIRTDSMIPSMITFCWKNIWAEEGEIASRRFSIGCKQYSKAVQGLSERFYSQALELYQRYVFSVLLRGLLCATGWYQNNGKTGQL